MVDLNHGGARLVCDLGLANTNTHAAHKNSTTACNNFCFLRKQRKKKQEKEEKWKGNSEKNEPLRACCQSNAQTVLCISMRTARRKITSKKQKNSHCEVAKKARKKRKKEKGSLKREKLVKVLNSNLICKIYLFCENNLFCKVTYSLNKPILQN